MRPDLYVNAVLAKCEALKSSGLWEGEHAVNPRAWLNNFKDDEKTIAAVILDNFVYYSNRSVDHLLISAFVSLRDNLVGEKGQGAADDLFRRAVFTRVDGEWRRPTDSGNLFCRKARQALKIPDEQFVEPAVALAKAAEGHPVIFLDDFIGSGNQFRMTWGREYATQSPHSFAELFPGDTNSAIYLALVATEYGIGRTRDKAPGVRYHVVHTLNSEYDIKQLPQNQLAPAIPNLGDLIDRLLAKHAPQFSLPDSFEPEERKYGYHSLGLTLAFEHGTPDSTIPLLWGECPAWNPLVRRV